MKAYRVVVLMITAAGLAATCRAQWVNQLLNNYAVTNEQGAIVVLHDGGGHYQDNPDYAPECAFDGNNNTFYDANNGQAAWVGFELESPKLITGIRYRGRNGYARRVPGTLVQGANESDFSDAVTLWELQPPADWNPELFRDEHFRNPAAATNAFTFVRLQCTMYDSRGGDFTRVEFYGADPMDPGEPPPDTPELTYGEVINWRMNLRWAAAPSSAILYEIERKIAHEGDFSPLTFVYATEGVAWSMNYCDASLMLYTDAEYRVRAINVSGASAWTNITAVARNGAPGQWIGTPGAWNNTGNPGTHAFDGNIMTEVNGSGEGFWSGLDFGREREITGIRYVPRRGFPARMINGVFEVADNPDFVNATVIYTVTNQPPVDVITEVAFDIGLSVMARYARYYPPDGGLGDVSEIEFAQGDAAPFPPTSLSIASSDITNAYAVLTWRLHDVPSLISSVMVYRATSPGGPYTLMTPDGVALGAMTWTDTAITPGIRYYYKTASLFDTGTALLEGAPGGYAIYIPAERLERDWSDLTQVKPGMTVLGQEYVPYSSNYEVTNMFDGDPTTSPDTSPAVGNPAVGVDLGQACCIDYMRFMPRSNFSERLNGAELRGSNDPDYTNNFTRLASFAGGMNNQYTIQPTVIKEPFRYIFVQWNNQDGFYGNIAELELYGWNPAASQDTLTAPTAVGLSIQPNGIRLDWETGTAQDGYRIERSADGVTWATTLGTTPGGTFTDATFTAGQRAYYRVTAVRGASPEEVAHSDTYDIVAYTPGYGTGLTATYYTNYFLAYNPAEAWAGEFLEPAPDWNLAGQVREEIPNSVSDFRIVWTGKLIVPFTGDYTFYLTSDDGIVLQIDGNYLINNWRTRGATTDEATTHLTAGEHTLRIDYFQEGGGKAMKLEWGGAVDRALIPATQLLPLPPPPNEGVFTETPPWQGRTFRAQRLGWHTLAPDGTLTVASAASELGGNTESFHFVWQRLPLHEFVFEATVEMDISPSFNTGKAFLMLRNELSCGSPFLALSTIATSNDGGFNVKQRLEPDANIGDAFRWSGPLLNPARLRIKRTKGVFSFAYRADDASPWAPLLDDSNEPYSFDDTAGIFGSDLYIGFGVCAPGTPAQMFQTATFSDITLKKLGGTVLLLK
ncbi:MAG: discoidin domain-containing protein [Kiritimatiellaeota bacterium]|nr:discoidin domain-containing protein [Kiritimatiellota bacterium]